MRTSEETLLRVMVSSCPSYSQNAMKDLSCEQWPVPGSPTLSLPNTNRFEATDSRHRSREMRTSENEVRESLFGFNIHCVAVPQKLKATYYFVFPTSKQSRGEPDRLKHGTIETQRFPRKIPKSFTSNFVTTFSTQDWPTPENFVWWRPTVQMLSPKTCFRERQLKT